MINQQTRRFYDSIADEYDQMISFKTRIEIEESKFRNIVKKYSITRALDAGAGSGFHSILLARCGVQVTAVDISGEMLSKLRKNALNWGLLIDTVKSDFLKLNLPASSFDAVICLGNSLVHLLTIAHLRKTISNFATLLKPGGVVIIQILNYDRILKHNERVQSVKKSDNNLYVRYYEFHKKQPLFNLLNIDTETLAYNLQSVMIRPVLCSEIKHILKNSGFVKIRFFNDLTLKSFLKRTSHDIVVTALKENSKLSII